MLNRADLIGFLKGYFDVSGDLELQVKMSHLDFRSGNISITELNAICSIVYCLKPSRVVEFGTFDGRTTINMAHNMPEHGCIVTVDLPRGAKPKFELANGKNEPGMDELGYIGLPDKLFLNHDYYKSGKITQVWSDTAAINPKADYYRDCDLVFIDASHTEDNCYNDSLTAYAMVRLYGFIIWHDYDGWPGVTKAVNRFEEDYKEEIDMCHLKDTSLAVGWVRRKG